ncbi:unnamed protein product [Brassica napus]|uniref:(rape) hypothetical protein n=1 Tax=Brassica napus TaxID=3708 RepID=A0A816X8P1_BRANA|nr:unnamed protein product [Brassica napus]
MIRNCNFYLFPTWFKIRCNFTGFSNFHVVLLCDICW